MAGTTRGETDHHSIPLKLDYFSSELATTLWADQLADRFAAWDCTVVALAIAAKCRLGVLTVDAVDHAVKCIRRDYRVGGRYRRDLMAALDPNECAPRWAQCLMDAAVQFPALNDDYPIRCPADHEVGKKPCFDRARKGKWSEKCFRAAWGNTFPFGLALAEKPCPACLRPMHYWCLGRRGEKAYRWTVDHIVSHARGGCVCYFNLRAMHPGCNSSKGRG